MAKYRVGSIWTALGLTLAMGVDTPVRAEPASPGARFEGAGLQLAGRPVSGAMTERSAIQSVEDALDAYEESRLARAEDYYAAATYLSRSKLASDRALAADLALVALDKGFMPARMLAIRVHRESAVVVKDQSETLSRDWSFDQSVQRPGTAPIL